MPETVLKESPVYNDQHFVVVRQWDRTVESLRQNPHLEGIVKQMGFDLQTLADLAIRDFPASLAFQEVLNAQSQKIEDVATEVLEVNGRRLERLNVIAYSLAAHPDPAEMTQFQAGGEVIYVTDGAAHLTYAPQVHGDSIPRDSLQAIRVEKGDLVLSTNIPNNWTSIEGGSFTFIYFVGNPDGVQRYGDVRKKKIPVTATVD